MTRTQSISLKKELGILLFFLLAIGAYESTKATNDHINLKNYESQDYLENNRVPPSPKVNNFDRGGNRNIPNSLGDTLVLWH